MNDAQTNPKTIIFGLLESMNALDLEQMLNYFDENYVSEGRLPREWHFKGRNQVRENWKHLPQRHAFRAEIHNCVCDGNEVWAEWSMFMPLDDGSVTETRGVIINEIRKDKIVRGRFYVSTIQHPVTLE